MAKSSQSRKKKKVASAAALASRDGKFNIPFTTGMPARDSVVDVIEVTRPVPGQDLAAAVAAPAFRIIRTNEVDAYEKAATSQEALAAGIAAVAAVTGDSFNGTARKAAKLSIGNKKTEAFTDIKDLIESLPAEEDMIHHNPPIKTTATSGRVNEEQRNVRVEAFLYAASREADNDFHLIVGRDPNESPEMYITMEISGLPPSGSAAFKKVKLARDAFKAYFGAHLPGITYDFYDPPRSIEIEGSLFFDMTHAIGSRPGPKSLKSRMPVIWEVHPVTKITFKN